MPLNPNIALSTRPTQIDTGNILALSQIKRQKDQDKIAAEDRTQKKELTDLQIQQARQQIANMGKEQSFQDLARDSVLIKSRLESGDIEGARSEALDRLNRLNERRKTDPSVNTAHTERFLQALEQDPQQAKQLLDGEIQGLTQLGYLQKSADGGFTLSQGQTRFDAQGNEIASVGPESRLLSPEEEAQKTRLAQAGRSQTNVSVGTGENAATKKFGEGIGERADKRVQAAFEANNQNVQLDRVMLAIESGAETGAGQETLLNLKNFGQSVFGLEFDENVGEQEVIRKISNEMALRLRNPESGLGLTGNTSNKDLQFLKDSVIGLSRTPQGNKMIIEFMKRQNQMTIDVAREQNRIIAENNGVVPSDIDTKLMNFVDEYQFFKPGERATLESLVEASADSGGKVGRFKVEVIE